MIERVAVEPADSMSPCVQLCTLNTDDVCLGCARTIDEIAAWGTMPADARRAVLASLPQRMAGLS